MLKKVLRLFIHGQPGGIHFAHVPILSKNRRMSILSVRPGYSLWFTLISGLSTTHEGCSAYIERGWQHSCHPHSPPKSPAYPVQTARNGCSSSSLLAGTSSLVPCPRPICRI